MSFSLSPNSPTPMNCSSGLNADQPSGFPLGQENWTIITSGPTLTTPQHTARALVGQANPNPLPHVLCKIYFK